MKVNYIANVRIPTEKAHGIQIMKMCEAFSMQGIDVKLVVPRRNTTVIENPYEYYKVQKNFNIVKLWCLDFVKYGKIGFWIEEFTFGLSVCLNFLLKDEIFYTREEYIAFFLSFLNKKVIWEAHRGTQNFFTKYLINHNKKIVVISKGLQDLYLKDGIKPSNILVSPDAVDINEFFVDVDKTERKKELSLPLNKKIIMYAGLLDKWKGVDTLLEASKFFGENQLVILGGTKEEVIKLQELYPEVIFLGYRPYSELPINQQVADILVIPNSGKQKISSHFTSPIKLFAHMTSGTPLLISDLPSMREVVDESMVTFFEPDNPTSLSRAVNKIFDNYFDALNKAQISKEEVTKYTWLNRAKRIKEFIE